MVAKEELREVLMIIVDFVVVSTRSCPENLKISMQNLFKTFKASKRKGFQKSEIGQEIER